MSRLGGCGRGTRRTNGGCGAGDFVCRNGLASSENPGDRPANWNHIAWLGFHSGKNTVGERFHFDNGLIRFDLQQNFALSDGFAFFLTPGNKCSRVLRHF